MSRLLSVAARELRERWLLFPAALAIGFFPLVLPAFGVMRGHAPIVGLAGAVLFGLAAAVVIGSSMLARDAANGRLGFLFSRPLPWGTIWGGKWLAALVAASASGFLAAIPWMVAFPLASVGGHHGDSWLKAMHDGPGFGFLFLLIVLAVGIANINGTAFRSRSPWLALDLVLTLAAFWAVRRYVAPLWWYGVLGTGQWMVAVGFLPLALALVVGSLAQVAVGRTDLRRAHRALSLGFWAVVGLTLVTAAVYLQWIRLAGPAELSAYAVAHDPAGRWVYVEGHAPRSGWYPYGYLIDATNGRYVRRPDPDVGFSFYNASAAGFLFSADGRFGALPRGDRDDRGAALSLFDLTGGTPRLTEIALESSPPPTWTTAFALSPSAGSVFVVHESGASLFALPSGRRVATTTIPPGWQPSAVRFLQEGAARAWLIPSAGGPAARPPRAEMRVVDLATDGARRSVSFPIAASLDPAQSWSAVIPDTGGERIVTADAGLHLRDGATGELVATLAGAGRPPALFLADGRIVVGDGWTAAGEVGPSRTLLRVFDRKGTALGEARLDLRRAGLVLGPEVAPGRLSVSCFRSAFLPEDTLVVDVGDGRIVERLPGLQPRVGFWDVSSAAPAGARVTNVHFFRDVEGRVVRIDFATGERKVVAGPGAPRGERISAR